MLADAESAAGESRDRAVRECADRLNQALAALPEKGVAVLPLWSKIGEPAKRVIVQARKGSNAPFALLPGLVLHTVNGTWTPEADDVLRPAMSSSTRGMSKTATANFGGATARRRESLRPVHTAPPFHPP